MLYAILCYNSEDVVGSWTKEEDDAVMAKLAVVQEKLAAGRPARAGRPPDADDRRDHRPEGPRAAGDRRPVRRDQGAAARLLHRRLRGARGGDRDRARLARASSPAGAYEIRPISLFRPGSGADVTDIAWIDAALTSARPQALGALLRYFRDLDTAEEAFQEACLRALKNWPQNGPPRDPAAWLIFVGRNAAIDEARRRSKQRAAARRRADLRSGRCRSGAGRAARRRALPRRHPAPAVHLLPSRSAGDPADRAGAAHRLRPVGQADRARLPGRRERHGAAHHPRQGPHRRGRRAVRDAGRRRSGPSGSPPSRR